MNQLLQDGAINIGTLVDISSEERLIGWNTYANLKLWFDTWVPDLKNLGFRAHVDGKVTITEEQISRILNLD